MWSLLLVPLLQVAPSAPEADLEQRLGFELDDVLAWPEPPTVESRHGVAAWLGRPPGFFDSLELFTGRGRGPGARVVEPLVIARLLLSEPLQGARLELAVSEDGRLAHAAAHGLPELDADPESSWALFLGQMCAYGSLGPDDEFVQRHGQGVGAAEIDARLAELARPGPDAEFVAALIEQRLTMRSFTLLERRLLSIPESPPPVAWLAEADARFQRLAELSPRFEAVLGAEAAAEHARRAREASLFFRRLREAAPIRSDYEAAARRVRNLCGQCHDEPSVEGEAWEDALERTRRDLSLPSGMLRVGYDLAPAWGDDGRASQSLADAVRGALVLIDGARRR